MAVPSVLTNKDRPVSEGTATERSTPPQLTYQICIVYWVVGETFLSRLVYEGDNRIPTIPTISSATSNYRERKRELRLIRTEAKELRRAKGDGLLFSPCSDQQSDKLRSR